MILMYHKVHPDSPSVWWVTPEAFRRQMADLADREVVPLDDYDASNPRHACITFDGVYANVLEHAAPILEEFGYPFELFVIGDWVGRDNAFDQGVEPPCRFASPDELDELVAAGGRVQWHTASHRRLAGLDADTLAAELTPPAGLRERFEPGHLRWFAFPHGDNDPAAAAAAADRFAGAVASDAGGDAADRFRLPRVLVRPESRLGGPAVSLIVVNHNCGHLLDEALDSVARQTLPADELLLVDDASGDDSEGVFRRRRDVADGELRPATPGGVEPPGVFRLVRQPENLGTVETFRRAVAATTGELIVFLGADNRVRCDYLERCRRALMSHPGADVAYTDVLLFGPRAGVLAQQQGAGRIGTDPFEGTGVYVERKPDPTPAVRAAIAQHNFIHGSSMYRRSAYEMAGGYRESGGPEDHHLFARILAGAAAAGRPGCVRVPEPVLEYRQHAVTQRNTLLSRELEVAHLRKRLREQEARHARELGGMHAALREAGVAWPTNGTAESADRG